jgi:hypothetical protein
LLERTAGLMVKSWLQRPRREGQGAGKEKGYVFMESSVYTKVKRETPLPKTK